MGCGIHFEAEAFAGEYPVDLNAAQAAVRARYSGKTAYSVGPAVVEKC